MKEIINKHKEFFDSIKKIENPNRGGCLYIAYAFYLYLDKNNFPLESFNIKQYSRPYDDAIETNIAFLNGVTDRAVSSSHYTWMYEGYEFDSNLREKVEVSFSNKTILLPINDYNLFCNNALVNGDWNEWFDRGRASKILLSDLGINLMYLNRSYENS